MPAQGPAFAYDPRVCSALASGATFGTLRSGDKAFTNGLLARGLAAAANGFGLAANALFGGLLKILAELHLAEDAFALKALLENAEGLLDVVVAYLDLQKIS